jgi:hypothetical protein
MTPQHYIQQNHKTQKEQLELCFKVLNHYLCVEDIKQIENLEMKKQ